MLLRPLFIMLVVGILGVLHGCVGTSARSSGEALDGEVRAEGIRLSILSSEGAVVTVSAGKGTWNSGVIRLHDVAHAEGIGGACGEVLLVQMAADGLSVDWETADDDQP